MRGKYQVQAENRDPITVRDRSRGLVHGQDLADAAPGQKVSQLNVAANVTAVTNERNRFIKLRKQRESLRLRGG